MNEYNESATCVKCGHGDIASRFLPVSAGQRALNIGYANRGLPNPYYEPEAIARTCKRCKYVWLERPLDCLETPDKKEPEEKE